MSTPLWNVYDSFLARLEKDESITSLGEEDINEELFELFKNARTEFKTIRADLYSITETEEVRNPGDVDEYTVIIRELDNDITAEEVNILSFLMIVSLKERKLTNSEFYNYLGLTTKDFKQLSKASQLGAINKVVTSAQSRAKRMIDKYSRVKNDGGVVTTFIDEMSDL